MARYRFKHLFIVFLTIISQLANAMDMIPVPSLRHYAALSLGQQAQKTGKSVEAFLTPKHDPGNLPDGLIPFVDTIGAISINTSNASFCSNIKETPFIIPQQKVVSVGIKQQMKKY